MVQVLSNLLHGIFFSMRNRSPRTLSRNVKSRVPHNLCTFNKKSEIWVSKCASQGTSKANDRVEESQLRENGFVCGERESDGLPCIQTLREFPKEELFAKVVLVRFDSSILLGEDLGRRHQVATNALLTIDYLHEAGAKVMLVSDWCSKISSKFLSLQSVADFLSAILQLRVVPAHCDPHFKRADALLLENLSKCKGELANCSKFAEKLSSGVDIFVNDSFSLSHKILSSTVGVAQFCYASIAGLHFEESLNQLKKTATGCSTPYVAIIGGGNLSEKVAALLFLASRCDGLVFVGMMAFQIMHALGLSVPQSMVEHGAHGKALNLMRFAEQRRIQILCPKDFRCINNDSPIETKTLPANAITDGWSPIDLGPVSADEINSYLIKCKKIIWTGPVRFSSSNQDSVGTSTLVLMLDRLVKSNCDVTVVGETACNAIMQESVCPSVYQKIENATVVWEFLKGRKLPGLMSLDRAYSSDVDWHSAYSDPTRPLVVDIGSGNGLFLFKMAIRRKDMNFLGLEINEKLVRRCLSSIAQSEIKNSYFIATNATSTFRSIVSSYPGELILVTILCPNPDFSNPVHRWRMLQRSLVEAIVDLLKPDGKVYLQSDIEEVALRMKELFLKYGKDKLLVMPYPDDAKIGHRGWLEENPFGVYSDWEQHVLDRSDQMYRLILSRSMSLGTTNARN